MKTTSLEYAGVRTNGMPKGSKRTTLLCLGFPTGPGRGRSVWPWEDDEGPLLRGTQEVQSAHLLLSPRSWHPWDQALSACQGRPESSK